MKQVMDNTLDSAPMDCDSADLSTVNALVEIAQRGELIEAYMSAMQHVAQVSIEDNQYDT